MPPGTSGGLHCQRHARIADLKSIDLGSNGEPAGDRLCVWHVGQVCLSSDLVLRGLEHRHGVIAFEPAAHCSARQARGCEAWV